MIQDQFEELRNTGELPSPSGVGMRILVETQREDCSLDEIVEIIQADPALTGRIIKLSYSAQFGSAVEISTCREAAIRLGLRTVSNVALGFTLVAGNRSGQCEAFDYDRYWSWSLANATAANILSRELKTAVPAEAFTCALLVRIGELALASVHPSDYADVLRQARKPNGKPLRKLESERFQIDHCEVASAMLADWGLPGCFGEVGRGLSSTEELEEIDDPRALELIKVLRVSMAFADMCVAGEDERPTHWPMLESMRAELDVSTERFEAICDDISKNWAEWGETLKVPTFAVPAACDLRLRAADLETAESANGDEPGGGLRILAVDDDAVSLRLLQRHLERAGHTVVTASNGKQALAAALETNPRSSSPTG